MDSRKKGNDGFFPINGFNSNVDRRNCSQTQITAVVKSIAKLNSVDFVSNLVALFGLKFSSLCVRVCYIQ